MAMQNRRNHTGGVVRILIQITDIMIRHNISYILNIDLQCSFIMVKVLGELEALVIKGEDRLKEGQHLKISQQRKKQTRDINLKSQQVIEKQITKSLIS